MAGSSKWMVSALFFAVSFSAAGEEALPGAEGIEPPGVAEPPSYDEGEPPQQAQQNEAGALPQAAQAEPPVDNGSLGTEADAAPFRQALSPYGQWLNLPGYGWVWQPSSSVVGENFFPYGSGGYWVHSDYGWYFASSYSWGWAAFHYGRWAFRPVYGWMWIPGRHWAPAWVSWRYGGGYVGWSPLGLPWMHVSVVAPSSWCFVHAPYFGRRNIYAYAVPSGHFHSAYAATAVAPGQMVHGGSRWNVGPAVTHIASAMGRPIRSMAVPTPAAVRMGHAGGGAAMSGRMGTPAAPSRSFGHAPPSGGMRAMPAPHAPSPGVRSSGPHGAWTQPAPRGFSQPAPVSRSPQVSRPYTGSPPLATSRGWGSGGGGSLGGGSHSGMGISRGSGSFGHGGGGHGRR